MDTPHDKPHIDYPTHWKYKLVGRDAALIRAAVLAVIGDREHQLTPSNQSRKGNFLSLNLELTVDSEADRLLLYQQLGADEAIIYVL